MLLIRRLRDYTETHQCHKAQNVHLEQYSYIVVGFQCVQFRCAVE